MNNFQLSDCLVISNISFVVFIVMFKSRYFPHSNSTAICSRMIFYINLFSRHFSPFFPVLVDG